MRRDFNRLKNKVEIAFKTGGIADNDSRVCAAEAYKIARDLLLGGVGEQGICAGQVNEYEVPSFI